MAENLKPIDIDINLNQNISEEAPKATRANDEMTQSAIALEQELARLNKIVASMSVALEEQKKIAASYSGDQEAMRQKLEATESALASARNELQEYGRVQSEINRASTEGADVADMLNDARADLFGTEKKLIDAAGELISNQENINTVLDDSDKTTSKYSASNHILSAAIKEVCRGLGIENTQVINAIGNVKLITAFKDAWRKATISLTAAQKAMALATIATGIGAVIVAVTAAVYVYKNWKESQDEVNRALADNRKMLDSAAASVSKTIVVYEKMRSEYSALGDDMQAKKKYIDDNQKSFDQLGVSVTSVNDADNIFIDNAENFREAILIRAQAVAAMEIAAEKYKQSMEKMNEAEERRLNPSFGDKFRGQAKSPLAWIPGAGLFTDFDKEIKAEANKAADALETEGGKLQAQAADFVDKNIELEKKQAEAFKKSGAAMNDAVVEGTKAFYEQQKTMASARMAKLKDTQKDTQEWKQAVKEYNDADSKLKLWDIAGQNKSAASASKKAESEAEKARKKAQSLRLAQEKQSLQAIRAAEDLEMRINEAEIKAMDEGSEKVLAQMELNHKKQMLALERQQEDALKTKINTARSIFEADPDNKGKTFDDSAIRLSEEELNKYRDLQTKQTEIFEKEKFNLELQYMRDYISEYGTFQQKKLAIAQEYDKKIAASGNEYEKKSLENQKQTALSAVDFEAINKRIDWQAVFGDLTGMLDGQLKELLSNLKEYVKSDQFRASSDTDKKTVYEAIEKLRSVTPGGEGTLNFNVIRQQMEDLGVAVNKLQTATLNEKTASENLAKAQKEYDNALKTGNQTIIESASIALDVAQTSANEAVEAYKNAESNFESLGYAFRETSADTIDGLNLVADGLSNFASNSLPQIFKGLQNTVTGLSKLNIGGEVGKAIGSLSESLQSAGTIAQIVSAILSILDILKDGIGSFVANILDTIFNAIDGILKDLLSGQILIKIGDSLKNGISNILNTISFGGFNSLVSAIGGGNAKETAETISRLTSSNEALKVSVDALKDEIAGANGAKSIKAYFEAVEGQKRYEKNLQDILNAQMKYSSSHHSNSYYWDLDPDSMKEINALLGTTLKNTWSDFSELTADQMAEIRKHLPDVWSEMINQGKYGDRFKDDWNSYADQAGKVVELTEELRENIAQISFDSLRDSFVNALMDMDADAQSFAGNFEEYMTKALLNFAIGDLLDDDLKRWYNEWTDTINSQGGKLTEEQIEQYRKQWEAMVQQGLDVRDEIAGLTGYTGDSDPARTGTSKGLATASQDSINELNGNFYAILQHVGDIRNLNREANVMRDAMRTYLSRITENTEYCRYIPLLIESIEDMKSHGLKMKV